MESMHMLSWDPRTLISELIHGMEAAKQLRSQIGESPASAPVAETNEILVRRIVTSYEKALLMLNWSRSPPVQPITPAATVSPVKNPGIIPESPASLNESPRSEEILDGGSKESNLQGYNFNSKKRKMMPKWTEQVRISPERGLDGPQDDGYNWRKYGQKDILGARFPRSYYRCTYRNTQNCLATKQVQRSDGDPTVFEVTYRGTHTCCPQAIPSPAKQVAKKPEPTGNYQKDLLDNLRSNLTVRTEGLDDAFSFPATSFYDCDFGVGGFCHVSGSDPTDYLGLISANTSTGSSPIFHVDFPFDPTVEIDAGFPTFLQE
ncbi:PREDICTED: probable WRKY transcription factor 53 isoform X2 [Tarenaya hassleriana]|uniref:probable WRKY transcription factor 53 isoform X2 n=1 Tax=Tarenaya hassleriana TaxID=28532 RepID=UPI00053C1F80|nr:PREDICTED: probable WRKY transcription factor 53 isoform X2 [Tarenaya hassleriana]